MVFRAPHALQTAACRHINSSRPALCSHYNFILGINTFCHLLFWLPSREIREAEYILYHFVLLIMLRCFQEWISSMTLFLLYLENENSKQFGNSIQHWHEPVSSTEIVKEEKGWKWFHSPLFLKTLWEGNMQKPSLKSLSSWQWPKFSAGVDSFPKWNN